MTFDDLKIDGNIRYSGMRVGTGHIWDYPNGIWKETKIKAPDTWKISFSSDKVRQSPAPEGSGAPIGTEYHWYILADQKVIKVDKDAYHTEMTGMKYKIGHKRPYWKQFSYVYPEQKGYRERLIDVLNETIKEIEALDIKDSKEPTPDLLTVAKGMGILKETHQRTQMITDFVLKVT